MLDGNKFHNIKRGLAPEDGVVPFLTGNKIIRRKNLPDVEYITMFPAFIFGEFRACGDFFFVN